MNQHDRLFVADTNYIPCWVWASAHARNATTDEEIAAVLIREELWLQSEVFSRVAVPRRGSQSNRGVLCRLTAKLTANGVDVGGLGDGCVE